MAVDGKEDKVNQMIPNLASSITKAASKQTYFTIRFLVDRERVEDAYRAYAYFRWVDDILDAQSGSDPERKIFLERQKALLEACFRGEPPRDVDIQEQMLVALVQHDQAQDSGLKAYLRNMMLVMDFDARRRGRLISQAELNEYMHWLAVAVTEALHYFIGHDDYTPHDATRYLAVSAAHIAHMLRDTAEDMQLGYYNIPREVLEANHIWTQEIKSEAFPSWVKSRVDLAREYFEAGKAYFAQVQNPRCRLAGMAYISRFEWVLDTIESEGYRLRPQYNERKSLGAGMRMGWLTLSALLHVRRPAALPQPLFPRPLEKL
jgi:phytoene/squalene synthetase